MTRAEILGSVSVERERQEQLRASGSFPWTCAAPDVADSRKLAVLVEEVGEVARLLIEPGDNTAGLRLELRQVAAVAVAWLEALEQRGDATVPPAVAMGELQCPSCRRQVSWALGSMKAHEALAKHQQGDECVRLSRFVDAWGDDDDTTDDLS